MPLDATQATQANNSQQVAAAMQQPATDATEKEGSLAGRSVRQEPAPEPRSVKWLAFKNGLKLLFEKLRGNRGQTSLLPKPNDFDYKSDNAKAHVANALNELGASRPRPKELLANLYLAAGSNNNEQQAGFDSQYNKAMKESLESLPDHQLYRMQQRLGKMMDGYEDALREAGDARGTDIHEQRVGEGLRRTGDKLAQLREGVNAELQQRGYDIKAPKSQVSAQTRQETVDAIGKFGAERITIGYKGFSESELEKIETGLNEIVQQQEAKRPQGAKLDEQFGIDYPREELHLDSDFGMRHVTEELQELPEDDAAARMAHVTSRIQDACEGDEETVYRLSSLLTQSSTADAHKILTTTKEGKYAPIQPPVNLAGDTGIAGNTTTRFDVRREDDDTLSVTLRCKMEPHAISSTTGMEPVPIDTRESSLEYMLFFLLHDDGEVELKEGHYNYHLQV